MTDQKTLACINLYGVFAAIPKLLELDAEASAYAANTDISIGFAIKNTACATLHFINGKCEFIENTDKCDILLPFSTPEKFNKMINGEATPIPSKGFTKLSFLLKSFTKITDILTKYLRADQESLKDKRFFESSTILMLHVIGGAISQIGNNDKIGKASAGYIVDGNIKLSIKDVESLYISVNNHYLVTVHKAPESYLSYMEFKDIKLARDLFDGKVNAVVCVGMGDVRIGGMISQIDNINRILDRVALYLA